MTQSGDEIVDAAVEDVGVPAADGVEQAIARQNLARPVRERRQHRELAAGQLDLLAARVDERVAGEVERQPCDGDGFRSFRFRSGLLSRRASSHWFVFVPQVCHRWGASSPNFAPFSAQFIDIAKDSLKT